eukprot:CAMPEP_0114566966 /NCGR_PEP_ID=MMETSP0114-20121206/15200_1 /TAXON_ID=31324 /ORGANISM="Goniomonas sp, Strain m" /LENGTH=39 /DNA_ID= /DNA_START= /DNA_END= /DNA_ORIENTATION=
MKQFGEKESDKEGPKDGHARTAEQESEQASIILLQALVL